MFKPNQIFPELLVIGDSSQRQMIVEVNSLQCAGKQVKPFKEHSSIFLKDSKDGKPTPTRVILFHCCIICIVGKISVSNKKKSGIWKHLF